MNEREKFEAWYGEHYTTYLPKTGGGEYCNLSTLLAWNTWQASRRAALEGARVHALIERYYGEIAKPGGIDWGKRADFASEAIELLEALSAPSPEAPAVDALTTGEVVDPMDVLLERLKSGGDYTAPLYTANQGNETKVFTRERLAVLVDHHKAHDGSVDSFELADSFIALLGVPTPSPEAPAVDALTTGAVEGEPVAWARPDLLERLGSPIAYSAVTELLKKQKDGYMPLYAHPASEPKALTDEEIESMAQSYMTSSDDGIIYGAVAFARALLKT